MWPNHEPTEELLANVRAGQTEAVNQLLERHRHAVHRLVQMRLDAKIQRRLDISDVVQDVLVEANRRLNDYLANPQLNFHLWLRQITQDRIIDAHRRHRVSAKRSVDREQHAQAPLNDSHSALELLGQIQDAELTPAAAVAQQEMTRRVEDAIARMPEGEAEIILMRHYEHLSNSEVAQALALSEPAASMRYLRALRKLREYLGNSGDISSS
jgi:RNA polymerase sigma-70 factor, ECF subfamily